MRLPRCSGHDRAGSLKSGVSRLPGTAPALATGAAVLRQALTDKLGTTTLGEIYAARGIGLAVPAVEMTCNASS